MGYTSIKEARRREDAARVKEVLEAMNRMAEENRRLREAIANAGAATGAAGGGEKSPNQKNAIITAIGIVCIIAIFAIILSFEAAIFDW